jgi:hypothetical protein
LLGPTTKLSKVYFGFSEEAVGTGPGPIGSFFFESVSSVVVSNFIIKFTSVSALVMLLRAERICFRYSVL